MKGKKEMVEKTLKVLESCKDRLNPLESALFTLMKNKPLSDKEWERLLALLDLGTAVRIKEELKDAEWDSLVEFLKQFKGEKVRLYHTRGLLEINFLGKTIHHPFLEGIVYLPDKGEVVKFSMCSSKTLEELEEEGENWEDVIDKYYLEVIEDLEKLGLEIENISFIPYTEWSKWIGE